MPSVIERLRPWQAAGVFALLTAVLTWPQVRHPFQIADHFDPYFSLWRLAWIAHQLPLDPAHLFDTNAFHPLRHTLAYSDAVILQGLFAAPFLWIGLPVALVYNAQIFATFVLCGLGTFLLVRSLTASPIAGLLSGIIFAFAAYRFDHYVHLELMSAQWMPLALWKLHETLRSGRLRDGLMTGLFAALQALSCVYFAVFFATVLAVVGPILWLSSDASMRRRSLQALTAGALLAAALALPYALPYRAARNVVGERAGESALVAYAAGPKHYLATMPENVLYGGVTGSIGVHEKRLFPGFLAMALAAIALWPPLDRSRIAYFIGLAIAVDISFGHRGLLLEFLRAHVEVYRGLRVAARIGGVALLFVAVLAGFGIARVMTWVTNARQWATSVPLILGAIMCAEYANRPLSLVAVDTTAPAVYQWLAARPPAVVAEFPSPVNEPQDLVRLESRYLYYSTFHWRPMINGYSGFWPAAYIDTVRAVRDFPADNAIAALRQRGVQHAIVHERFYGGERFREVSAALRSRADMRPHGPFDDGPYQVLVFELLGSGNR